MTHPARNPYLPLWEYIPDGELRVFDDRLYIYGSHDFAGGEKGFCPGDYVVWNAPLSDLGDWQDVVLPISPICGTHGLYLIFNPTNRLDFESLGFE